MNSSTWLWIGLGVLALLVIGAILYFVLRNKDAERHSESQSLRQSSTSRQRLPNRRTPRADDGPKRRGARADTAGAEVKTTRRTDTAEHRGRTRESSETVEESQTAAEKRARRAEGRDLDK